MSSETRKKAWRSSVSQPRVADKRYSSGESARPRRIELVSTTEMPRLHFPPMVLYLSDFYVFSALSVPEKGEGEGDELTSWNHFRAVSGRPYCLQ